jgi:hypothetical protein
MNSTVKKIGQIYCLFAVPTFFTGAASCFDLFGSMSTFNYSSSPEKADCQELSSDWIMTGQDLKDAIEGYESKNEQV